MNRLYEAIQSLKGAQPVTLVAITEARLPSSHPLRGKVYKKATVNGFVNVDYAKKMAKMGKEAKQRIWGKPGSPIITHIKEGVQRQYINFIVQKVLSEEYVDMRGKPIPHFDASAVIRSEQPVKVRNYDLANIVELRALGKVVRG